MNEEDHIPGTPFDRGLRDTFWLLRRRLVGRKTLGPACRRCGYCVTGLREPRCPECGADLNKSGVIDPRRVRRWPVHALIFLVWSAAIAVIASFSEPWLVGYVVPRFGISDSAVAWTNRDTQDLGGGTSTREAIQSLVLIAETGWQIRERWMAPPPVSRIGLWIDTPPYTADGILVVDAGSGEASTWVVQLAIRQELHFPNDHPQETAPYSHELLCGWFNAMGIDASDTKVRELINEIHGLMQTALANADDIASCRMATLEYHLEGSSLFGHGTYPVGGVQVAYESIWITRGMWTLVWAAGVWFLAIRRRARRPDRCDPVAYP